MVDDATADALDYASAWSRLASIGRSHIWISLTRRLVESVLTLIAVVVITFVVIHLAPGSPADYAAGLSAPPGFLQHVKHEMGLDKPILVQLWLYLRATAHGNFGYSFFWQRPVNALILSRLPATLLLMAASWVLSIGIGVLLGIFAARVPTSKRDRGLMLFSLTAFSLPQFWVGMILILVFGVWLHALPAQGMYTVGANYTGLHHIQDVASHLILPAIALGLTDMAVFVRLTRTSILEVATHDFIRTARSKGIAENRVFFRHAFRNALLPLVTLMGMRFRYLFAGAVLIEAIFSWPGAGLLTLQSLQSRDYPVILGMTFWAAVLTVGGNLLADVAYAYIDPRVRSGRNG